MRPPLRRFATVGLATVVLATGGCSATRPKPTPGIGGESPVATTEKRKRGAVEKTLLVVAVGALVLVALVVAAAGGGGDDPF